MIKRALIALSSLCCISVMQPTLAQDEDLRPRAYVGRYIQLDPMMVPFQTARGIRYEVITVRLVIGANATARYACFVAPKLHEQIMFFLWDRVLSSSDFEGERQAGLAADILKYVGEQTDPRYYSAVELAGGYEEMDEASQNLSNLCK
ncbi:MAG: hypothetical protein RIC29_07375 [Rhodospirillaceae bacterium]